ncbi:MAG: PQQ-binding-like beta-propeller repeat protein, partial [Planctomycetes bacterium]|nr:PQQ-binding-like beta-propeller repeat protein [Planctomycetota bacterium]
NHTAARIPAELKTTWQARLDGRITAPTIAAGNVYVAGRNACVVFCLDAASGREKWRFSTAGPLDSPPTYYKGTVIFGSHDGSVYALDAENGHLAWRFRAAPADVQLTAYGRLESAWPVIGSVLVMNGKVYCVAGRSMHLDGGMVAYVLDARTGRVIQEAPLKADLESRGELAGAMLPDILVSDAEGRYVYMRDMRFDAGDISRRVVARQLGAHLRPNDGGLIEGTWFNSNFWTYKNAAAQMLVFDDKTAYCIKAQRKLIAHSYPQDIFTIGSGYTIFAVDLAGKAAGKAGSRKAKGPAATTGARAAAAGTPLDAASRRKSHRASPTAGRHWLWQQKVHVRGQSMVLTDEYLFLAGAPDVMDKQDPWGAFHGRDGGLLEVHSRKDGTKLKEYKLDAPAVYDGMAGADGRLYVSLANGTLICLGG